MNCRCNNCGHVDDRDEFDSTKLNRFPVCPTCLSENVRVGYVRTVSDVPEFQGLYEAALVAADPPDDMGDDQWLDALLVAIERVERRAAAISQPPTEGRSDVHAKP